MATDQKREESHHFTVGFDLVMFTGLVGYLVHATIASAPNVRRWGCVYVTAVGCVLMMLDPTRHVLLDHGGVIASEDFLKMYSEYPKLSPMGRFCQLSTIIGLLSLILGMLMYLRITDKVQKSLLS